MVAFFIVVSVSSFFWGCLYPAYRASRPAASPYPACAVTTTRLRRIALRSPRLLPLLRRGPLPSLRRRAAEVSFSRSLYLIHFPATTPAICQNALFKAILSNLQQLHLPIFLPLFLRPSCGVGLGRARVRGASPNAPPCALVPSLVSFCLSLLAAVVRRGRGSGARSGSFAKSPPRALVPLLASVRTCMSNCGFGYHGAAGAQSAAHIARRYACYVCLWPIATAAALARLSPGYRQTLRLLRGLPSRVLPWLSAASSQTMRFSPSLNMRCTARSLAP